MPWDHPLNEWALRQTRHASLLGRVAGPSADELGKHYAERVREWRTANLLRTSAAAQELLQARQVEGQEVPPSILWPLLERMSMCDDGTLAEHWAALLANAADPTFPGTVHPSYSAILAELTGTDAKLLSLVYAKHREMLRTFSDEPFAPIAMLDPSQWSVETVLHSTSVLVRQGVWMEQRPNVDLLALQELVVGITQRKLDVSWDQIDGRPSDYRLLTGVGMFVFSTMGTGFIRACSESPEESRR